MLDTRDNNLNLYNLEIIIYDISILTLFEFFMQQEKRPNSLDKRQIFLKKYVINRFYNVKHYR